MAIGALTTLWAAYLSVLARGSMAFTVPATVVGSMAEATGGVTAEAGMATVAEAGMVVAGMATAAEAGTVVAAQSLADRLAASEEAQAVSAEVRVDSTEVEGFTVEVDSMVEAATAAGTGNFS